MTPNPPQVAATNTFLPQTLRAPEQNITPNSLDVLYDAVTHASEASQTRLTQTVKYMAPGKMNANLQAAQKKHRGRRAASDTRAISIRNTYARQTAVSVPKIGIVLGFAVYPTGKNIGAQPVSTFYCLSP